MGRVANLDTALEEAVQHYDRGDKRRAESILTQLINQFPDHPGVVGLRAVLFHEGGASGVAVSMLDRATSLLPDNANLWNNLGACYTALGFREKAREAFEKGLEFDPNDVSLLANMGSTYSDVGRPEEALKWLDKALEIDPEDKTAKWNKALALLTKRSWKEGWELHEVGDEGEDRRRVRDYGVPEWAGTAGQRVVVSGEQGLGDEIMYATCIPDLLETCEVVFDCHPRLTTLWRRTWPEMPIYGTRKEDWVTWPHDVGKLDSWISIGSLPRFFRNDDLEFPGTPICKPNPEKLALTRSRFEQLGPPPYVGVTWFGGRKPDRILRRSVTLAQLAPILTQRGTFISLQYDAQRAEPQVLEAEEIPLKIHHYSDILEAYDYDETVHFVSACDLVIGVCQTVNHVAGALGIPHWVLVSDTPTWREGIDCTDMPWWESLSLYRKTDTWEEVIERVANDYAEAWESE